MACLFRNTAKINTANVMGSKKALSLLYVAIFCTYSSVSPAPSWASNSKKYFGNQNTAKNQNISEGELAATELKLLSRTYANDPLSKRLQRLELLAFGSTQYGSTAERWQNIQSCLRNKNAVSKENKNSGDDISSSLNDLEKYVFKKTTPTLSTAMRLDKLESKLFGQPTKSLTNQGRVARLQRTLGLPVTIGEMAGLPNSNQGFAPEINGESVPYFRHIQPGMPNTFGFNRDDMDDPDLSQFESQMNRMFGEMERHLQEQLQQTPNYQIQPRNPQRSPEFNAPHITPKSPTDKIPPYNDPNFI